MDASVIEPGAVVEAAVAVGACEDCARITVALLLGATGATPAPAVDPSGLTDRERAVLELLGHGHSASQIGHRLEISTGTVRKHLEHLYAKLGVHDRVSAAVRARELGLVAAPHGEPSV